ncbi:MAG: hypothetical protein GXP35_11585 [Actinobacteria bacterium]|nr:hypothetical protein [Actinomycetota bacterium]
MSKVLGQDDLCPDGHSGSENVTISDVVAHHSDEGVCGRGNHGAVQRPVQQFEAPNDVGLVEVSGRLAVIFRIVSSRNA